MADTSSDMDIKTKYEVEEAFVTDEDEVKSNKIK